MKKITWICLAIISSGFHNADAQNLLSLPESVVYDAPRSRYLVSNWGSGHVVSIDSTEAQSYFKTYQQCFAGLHIQDDILYVACREFGVKGFDLETGDEVFHIPIPEATNINDITVDNAGFVYVSYPTESRIYKADPRTEEYWLYVESGLTTPNGMYYDEVNNRLVLISYCTYSPVQAIDLTDSSLTTIASTSLHELDGLTRDSDGNWYVSSWYSNICYRFDSEFANPPEVFSTHLDDPADIYFDTYNNVLAVPLFFTSQLELVSSPAGINYYRQPAEVAEFILFPNYPNPFNARTVLSFKLPESMVVSFGIYNVQGQEILKLTDGYLNAGYHEVIFDASGLPGNLYFAKLNANVYEQARKLVLLK